MAGYWGPKQVDIVRGTLQSLKETRDPLEDSVWINAAIWASMAIINPVCERGPDHRRRANSLTSSGWSVAGVIYANVSVSCLPTCHNVPAKWAARPT